MTDRVVAWWRERTGRERLVVTAGVVVLAAIAAYVGVIDPIASRLAKLDRLIVQRQADFERVSRLGGEYRQMDAQVEDLDRRILPAGGFSLLSFLEETAATHQMRNRLTSIRPQPIQTLAPYREVSAEVKLESITLPQVVAYLTALDRAPQRLRVKYLRLKTRYADPKVLDGSFVVSTYERVS